MSGLLHQPGHVNCDPLLRVFFLQIGWSLGNLPPEVEAEVAASEAAAEGGAEAAAAAAADGGGLAAAQPLA